ncbi:lipoprotein [Firmicutes bacterium CAG:884]|nr:lipoprotein [Firmicutes bacterium CAG:884]
MKNGYSANSEFWNNTYRPYIRTVTFGNDLSNLPSNCTSENLCWDVSYNSSQNKKVYGYLIDSGLTVSETDSSTSTTIEKPLYNLYIVSEAPIFAPSDCSYIFSFFKYDNNKYKSNLVQINFNNNFNTSNVTDMYRMFYVCSSLTSLDLNSFNTTNVTDRRYMFGGCSSLTRLDLSNFNTSKVDDMSYMFENCSSLTSLDLSSFNTSSVTKMASMFFGCSSSLTSLDLSSFDTSKVTKMASMFFGCSSLTSLVLNSFNTSSVTNMGWMFYNCSSLTNLDLSNFNTPKVTDISDMFYKCSSLTSLDLSNFNTSQVTNMDSMFGGCSSLTSLDLSSFDTSKVTKMASMFENCKKLTTQINIMNTGTTSYSSMFSKAASDSSAHIIIGYTTDTETIATAMRDTCTDATAKARIELKKID